MNSDWRLDIRFFFDNCISIYIPKALDVIDTTRRELGRLDYEIHHLQDKFPADTPDDVWIQALDEEGDWFVISGDSRITRDAAVKRAWGEANLTTFFFAGNLQQQKIHKQAEVIFRRWPEIVRLSRETGDEKKLYKMFVYGAKFEEVDFSSWN